MKLQTIVESVPLRIKLRPDDRTMVLGSCFALCLGERMRSAGFNVCSNPFGVLYNPASIAGAMQRLSSGKPFTESECVEMGAGAGLVCSFSHHTSFARPTAEEFLANANEALENASDFWQSANKVVITLGTLYCFIKDGSVVSNCLKRPASEFERTALTAAEVYSILRGIVLSCPGKEFIFSVSPVRHLADGAHGNQLSKAGLLLAVDELLHDGVVGSRCEYFPAYEIVMDELRDYRFYAEDMIHPTPQTERYIWERFLESAVPPECHRGIAEAEKAARAALHRPNLYKNEI